MWGCHHVLGRDRKGRGGTKAGEERKGKRERKSERGMQTS